jgi:hypothetical protein
VIEAIEISAPEPRLMLGAGSLVSRILGYEPLPSDFIAAAYKLRPTALLDAAYVRLFGWRAISWQRESPKQRNCALRL